MWQMDCLQRWHDGLVRVLKNVLRHLEHMSWLHPNVMVGYLMSHSPKQTAHDDCSSFSSFSFASSSSSSADAFNPSVISMGVFTLTPIISDRRIHFVMNS